MASSQHESTFQISISEKAITQLHEKLALTSLPSELEDAEWEYGSPLKDIQRLVNRWRDEYDWRKHEAALNNELPQFTRDIEVEDFGKLNIHYVHKKSELESAIPLLFVHGWPGSFIEVRKILPLLIKSTPEHPSFHVVALSLPGYGFSEAPSKKGFALPQYAEVGHKLMIALGYDEYVTQGGDWGSFITRKMSHLYGPSYHKAQHTNLPLAVPPNPSRPMLYISHLLSGLPGLSYTAAEQAGIARTQEFHSKGSGYFAQHSTRPQTLGYALEDSPAGLLAWIYEKLVRWTDAYKWDDDEVLTWISLYHFSRAGPAASIRIYYEIMKARGSRPVPQSERLSPIPLGHSYFPKDIIVLPRSWCKIPNLIFESDHGSGGHFAAHEKPQELVGDLRKMFGKGGAAFGVVKGRNGYAS
ncbi:Alpha/Beta hydrolase protein [Collybia nuda]|uniref:Alpha/Beta hydrolase protein n=1 Tax=Collybia nuda TaxID=64659 RepID=A0A9P5YHD7_9AGAR|nr:Alpha/Beta hydrolase protein [Collybia nuda]